MNKSDIVKLIIKGLIGMAIGIALAFLVMSDISFLSALLFGLFFAGVPYGWQLSGRIIGGWFVLGSAPIMIFAFLIRLFISLVVGWIAYPIMLVYTIIKAIKS